MARDSSADGSRARLYFILKHKLNLKHNPERLKFKLEIEIELVLGIEHGIIHLIYGQS